MIPYFVKHLIIIRPGGSADFRNLSCSEFGGIACRIYFATHSKSIFFQRPANGHRNGVNSHQNGGRTSATSVQKSHVAQAKDLCLHR